MKINKHVDGIFDTDRLRLSEIKPIDHIYLKRNG